MDIAKFKNYDSGIYTAFCTHAQIEKDLNSLLGLIGGIGADGIVNEKETDLLKKWLNDVVGFKNNSPYKDIRVMIDQILEDGKVEIEELMDLVWLCKQFLDKYNPYFDIITTGTQKLTGILTGIEADGAINNEEIDFLKEYVDEYHFLKNTWPYDEVLSIINLIVDNKGYSGNEINRLKEIALSTSVFGSTQTNKDTISNMAVNTASDIDIPEKSFCITGSSTKYTRHEIASMIELYGGYVQDSVSGKLNYLVVCDQKNACWAFASYGRKIEKVKALQSKGKMVEIIYEEDLYLTIEKIKM